MMMELELFLTTHGVQQGAEYTSLGCTSVEDEGLRSLTDHLAVRKTRIQAQREVVPGPSA